MATGANQRSSAPGDSSNGVPASSASGEFLNELLAFPNARHDDQVDSVSQFLKWVQRSALFGINIGAPISITVPRLDPYAYS